VSEETDAERIASIFIPGALVERPDLIWQMLDQVIGANLRMKAHALWHETQDSAETLSPGEITIKYAQIQGLLDYADEVDPKNTAITERILEHFMWKIL
jgi:hypothetical protein